jgi:glycosyltransferase involved in cell wall biosynthesis
MTRVLLLSRYSHQGASSRLRTLQYVDELSQRGFDFTVDHLLGDAYLDDLYAGRATAWAPVARAYARRAGLRDSLRSFDVVWLEKEAFPWLPALAERWLLAGDTPLVVDYDDAIFHRYDTHPSALVRRVLGTKIDAVMRRAQVVVAGNAYLAERAGAAGAARIEIVPTAVDLERYVVRDSTASLAPFTVGWIGTPQTARHLVDMAPALRRVAAAGDTRFVFVGCPPGLDLGVAYEARPWSEATEVDDLRTFDVGVMPLRDAPFERGKCGYKLIQYMACAKPVVASPGGVNRQLVTPGVNGYLATTAEEWMNAMDRLQTDRALGQRLGAAGRAPVVERYCLQAAAPRLAALLRRAADT